MKREKTFGRRVEDLTKKHLDQFRTKGYCVDGRIDYSLGSSVAKVELYKVEKADPKIPYSGFRDIYAELKYWESDKMALISTYSTNEFDEALVALGNDWEAETGGKAEMLEATSRLRKSNK